MVLTIFPSVWPPIHQCQGQHGKVKLQGIRRNTDPVVQHAVWFGDDATIISYHFSAIFAKKVVETGILWQFYGLIYRPVQGHSLLNLLPKTKLSSKEQQKRLWCIQLALKPDVQHKITSNRLRPYGIDHFSIGLTTNSSMSRSTWKGQAAGNSKKYWPSCTACSVIRRWCNHHFSAVFAKKVVETGTLWQFYGLIYRPVQGHSLLNLLPKTKLSSKEQQKRLWCIQLALKPDVQHKITSNRLRPYGIDYFSIGLTTNSSMSRSTWKGQAAGNSKKYCPSCTACNCEMTKHCPEEKNIAAKEPTNSMLFQCWNIMRAFANHVLKAEMPLDTPIAVCHGSLLAYPQKVYKPTAYTYIYM